MIRIHPSQTADTRTCDFANTTKETLLASTYQHISDVNSGLMFFAQQLCTAGATHDTDKITHIDDFHSDFVTGFVKTDFWDAHRKRNRHHLLKADGVPADVNLVDVLDFITDCVMAGMARSGSVYELRIDPVILDRAFINTIELLKRNVKVVPVK